MTRTYQVERRVKARNQQVSPKITKANVLGELYAAKLTSKWARESSLFWLTRDFFPSVGDQIITKQNFITHRGKCESQIGLKPRNAPG